MPDKLSSNTFKVEYEDGTSDIVKPSSFRDLEDIEIIQKEIIKELVEQNGFIGSLISSKNKSFWANAEKLSGLLRVVGNSEKGIRLNDIDDLELLTRIFITTTETRHPDTGAVHIESGESLKPSLICKINGLNFTDLLKQVDQEMTKKKRKTKSTTKSNPQETTKQT